MWRKVEVVTAFCFRASNTLYGISVRRREGRSWHRVASSASANQQITRQMQTNPPARAFEHLLPFIRYSIAPLLFGRASASTKNSPNPRRRTTSELHMMVGVWLKTHFLYKRSCFWKRQTAVSQPLSRYTLQPSLQSFCFACCHASSWSIADCKRRTTVNRREARIKLLWSGIQAWQLRPQRARNPKLC